MHFYAFMNVGYAHTALILQCSSYYGNEDRVNTVYCKTFEGETFTVFYTQLQIFYLQRIAIGNHCYHKSFPFIFYSNCESFFHYMSECAVYSSTDTQSYQIQLSNASYVLYTGIL